MRCAFVLNFFILIFCCGLHANAEKISSTQTFSTSSQVRWHGYHAATEMTIEVISNQAVTSLTPAGNVHFKDHFLPPVIVAGSKILVRRLMPDLHAIVKSIIFPQHFFW
jgi:hypothetical protein